MNRKVVLSGYSLRAPGINSETNLFETISSRNFHPAFSKLKISENNYPEIGLNDFSNDTKYLPKPSLQKTMRPDVLASCICISELIEKCKIKEDECEAMPLFICNGVTLEPIWNENKIMRTAFFDENQTLSRAEKQSLLYQSFPPLSAIRTLTNATESFVSQVSGIAGNNATFGSTSFSGHYALLEGYNRIVRGECESLIIGGSFFAGTFSNLSLKNFAVNAKRRESMCAVFILLETEEKSKSRGNHFCYRLSEIKSFSNVASLYEVNNEIPYRDMIKYCTNGTMIYSGGLSDESFQKESETISKTGMLKLSWFPFLGSLGAVSVLMNVVTGVSTLQSLNTEIVNCLDCDPYGRESLIKISKY